MVMMMLNLETFKVVVKSTKNGGLFIKVGDHKVPYDVASQMDYMGQAAKFVESTLGLTVIGRDYTTIVASKQTLKISSGQHLLSLKNSRSKSLFSYNESAPHFAIFSNALRRPAE